MHRSDLLAYLRALSRPERTELRKFLASPWMNRRADVVRLFEHIDRHLDVPDRSALDRAQVWTAVHRGVPFDEKQWGHLAAYLLALVKKWLAWRELAAEPADEHLALCRALRRAGLDEFAARERQRLEKSQHAAPRSAQWHYRRYRRLGEEQEARSGRQRNNAEALPALTGELTTFFMAELLRYACSAETRRTVNNRALDLALLPAVLAHLDADPNAAPPAVALYYRGYRALSGRGDETDFHELKRLMAAHWQQFPTAEIRDLWLLAINYCIGRLNTGEGAYVGEAFALYRQGLENGVLLEDGLLSAFAYKNIARLGIALDEEAWVDGFLEQYRACLPPRQRENVYRYNRALFHFHRRQYAEAMRLLTGVELDDVYNQLDARYTLLVCYYELGEIAALHSLLDSFSTYVQRRRDIGYQRENYLNLVRFTRRLIDLPPGDRAARRLLAEAVGECRVLAGKAWLLEKLAYAGAFS